MDQQCSTVVKHWTMSLVQNVHFWPWLMPSAKITTDQSLDWWLSVCHSDIVSAYQHFA